MPNSITTAGSGCSDSGSVGKFAAITAPVIQKAL